MNEAYKKFANDLPTESIQGELEAIRDMIHRGDLCSITRCPVMVEAMDKVAYLANLLIERRKEV